MSAVISAFPPQSTGGGGTFVLKPIRRNKITANTELTNDLPYGGLLCFSHTNGRNFNIRCGDLYVDQDWGEAFTVLVFSGTNIHVYQIPLSPGTLSFQIANSTFYVYVYGYELM